MLKERTLFLKFLAYIGTFTCHLREAVLLSLDRYVALCARERNLADIEEVILSVQAKCEDILADVSDENQQSFLRLILTIAQLNTVKGDALLAKVLPLLA